jgi:hypothetical protein
MIIKLKNKIILFLIFVIFCSCSVEKLRNPITVVKKPDFNEQDFKNRVVAILPPASGDKIYTKTIKIVLQSILKEKFQDRKLIFPETTAKLINQKGIQDKLDRVYAIYGDAEDNVLFAAAIGIELKAKYTVYSKITNIINYGKRIIDIEKLARYNQEYKAVEETVNVRMRYFKKTMATGYLKIVDNEKHKVVWSVDNFKTEIRKLSGFKSIPIEDVINRTYGDDYYKMQAKYGEFPSASRIVYRFYDRILSKW